MTYCFLIYFLNPQGHKYLNSYFFLIPRIYLLNKEGLYSGQSDNEYGMNDVNIVDEAAASQAISQNETTRDGMYL